MVYAQALLNDNVSVINVSRMHSSLQQKHTCLPPLAPQHL
ncbi:hypothetical protein AG1IA_05502 [Rhizoctonia solani AG-1 IA]|uniref:Uncharacterized protein n=1 Tax=Thanatephorus cucumeris (strain AG1-IA) TaxID=983506 RepID=L8WUM3_THACA|nr:hypothetical protein AG1IA_05502 [Rhizoctonia solani AG-1 IA]